MASKVEQNNAIRGLRRNYPNVGPYVLAQAIANRDPAVLLYYSPDRESIDQHELTNRSFYSILNVIRRHDATEKQKAASAVTV